MGAVRPPKILVLTIDAFVSSQAGAKPKADVSPPFLLAWPTDCS